MVDVWFREDSQIPLDGALSLSVAALLEAHFARPQEANLVDRVRCSVAEPNAEQHSFGGYLEPTEAIFCGYSATLLKEIWSETLIGIQMKNPVIFERDTVQGKIPLVGEIGETTLEDAGAGPPGNLDGSVGTERVEYHNVVAPANRFETSRQVCLLIESKNEDRDSHGFSPGPDPCPGGAAI